MHSILVADLHHIMRHTRHLWGAFKDTKILLTGGTGLFGTWLLETIAWANKEHNLNVSVSVLTRDAEKFLQQRSHFANHSGIRFIVGDITQLHIPLDNYAYIIHAAATSAEETFHNEDPIRKYDTVVGGTRNILQFARSCSGAKMLYISSGAVYGSQPRQMAAITEDYSGAPDVTSCNAIWGESKRAAELLCCQFSCQYGLHVSIARCFSFVGPYLPLNIHYAAGNFIRDGLQGGPIIINSDGSAVRSYLYMADLVIWLLTILIRGRSRVAYNVGAGRSVSIGDLATMIAQVFEPSVSIHYNQIPNGNGPGERYVPDVSRACIELGLQEWISLEEAVRRTIHWYADTQKLSHS